MKIHIIAVGGTIDKIYFDAKSKYQIGKPAISKVLTEQPIHLNVQVTALMAKDSLDMNDADREAIKEAVLSSDANKIVITHGTDTMTDTAQALAGIKNKAIVLTGALQPAIFKHSDAEFNLGGALAAVQVLEHGVYIVMNGNVFDGLKVKKDRERNRFVEA